jgi:hypothetical protein
MVRPKHTDKEELNGERTPVCPVVIAITESLDGCVGQQLTDHNTQIDTRSGNTTEDNRRDLFMV